MGNPSRINSFDLLRGVAILLVLCVHTAAAFPTANKYLDIGLTFGRFGVQLFFFVSALTMCYMWELRQGETNPAGKFYIRRFLRIAPLFWLAIPGYLVANGVGQSYWAPEGIGLHQVLLTATFLHGFWPDAINSVVPGGWSIAVEMTFYMIFPWLITAVRNPANFLYLAAAAYFANLLLVGPLLASLLADHGLASRHLANDFLYLNFFNQAPVFLLGCYLYFQLKPGNGLNPGKVGTIFFIWLALAAATIIALGLSRTNLTFLLVILGEYLLVAFVLRKRTQYSIIEKLGRNSYAIYLGHFVVIDMVSKAAGLAGQPRGGIIWFLTALVAVTWISYMISLVSYNLLEKRIHNLAARLTK